MVRTAQGATKQKEGPKRSDKEKFVSGQTTSTGRSSRSPDNDEPHECRWISIYSPDIRDTERLNLLFDNLRLKHPPIQH